MTTIDERLARLERQNRWMKGVLCAITTLACGAGLMAAGGDDDIPTTKMLHLGESLVIGSPKMGPTIVLSVDGQEAWIGIHDKNGTRRTMTAFSPDGPQMTLSDSDSKDRISLGITSFGPMLNLNDDAGSPRVMSMVFDKAVRDIPENEARLQVLAPGESKGAIRLFHDGNLSGLGVMGDDGKPRGWFGLSGENPVDNIK